MRAFYHTDDLDQAQREMRQNQARAAAQRLADRAAGGERAARDGAGRQAWWSRQNTIDLPSPDAPGSSFGRWLAIHLGLAFGYMFLLTMVCTRGLSSLLETPVPDGFWAKAPTFLAVWLTAHLLLIATLFARRLLMRRKRAARGLFGRVFFTGVKVILSFNIAAWWLTSWWQQGGV